MLWQHVVLYQLLYLTSPFLHRRYPPFPCITYPSCPCHCYFPLARILLSVFCCNVHHSKTIQILFGTRLSVLLSGVPATNICLPSNRATSKSIWLCRTVISKQVRHGKDDVPCLCWSIWQTPILQGCITHVAPTRLQQRPPLPHFRKSFFRASEVSVIKNVFSYLLLFFTSYFIIPNIN